MRQVFDLSVRVNDKPNTAVSSCSSRCRHLVNRLSSQGLGRHFLTVRFVLATQTLAIWQRKLVSAGIVMADAFLPGGRSFIFGEHFNSS